VFPELFNIGGFPIRNFGVMLLVGFALGTWLAVRRAGKYGIDKDALTSLAVWAVLMGVLGARVFWVLQEWSFYSKNPGEILKVTEGGMTSYGGIVFGLLTVVIWCRRTKVPFPVVFDLLAAPALVMHGFGRIGCFLNGCCYGSPCELPWAVMVHPELGPTYLGHPAQLYDTLMAFAGVALLLLIEKGTFSTRRPGTYGALFFVFYGLSRFVYELFRSGYSSESTWGVPMTDAQVMALAMIAAGVIWLLALARRTVVAPDSPPPSPLLSQAKGGGTDGE
jgi:phosphatidylglycerol:prolipoprotein diacylglycerol transferase